MKLFKYFAFIALLTVTGCTTGTIQVIETNGEKQVIQSPNDFKNETYIWESWIYPDVKK